MSEHNSKTPGGASRFESLRSEGLLGCHCSHKCHCESVVLSPLLMYYILGSSALASLIDKALNYQGVRSAQEAKQCVCFADLFILYNSPVWLKPSWKIHLVLNNSSWNSFRIILQFWVRRLLILQRTRTSKYVRQMWNKVLKVLESENMNKSLLCSKFLYVSSKFSIGCNRTR